MKIGSKILVGVILFLIVLSVSATFYKTVILQDFDVTGIWIEFPTEDSSYVWFMYDNEEYELDLETTNYEEILAAVASEVGVAEENLDADFVAYLETAYSEAEVTGTSEEGESSETEFEEETSVAAEEVVDETLSEEVDGEAMPDEDAVETEITATTSTEAIISI